MFAISMTIPGISLGQITNPPPPTTGCDISGSYFSWHDFAIEDETNPSASMRLDFVHPRSGQRQGDCGICSMFALTQEAEIRYRIWWYQQTGQLPDPRFPVNFSEESLRTLWFSNGSDNRFCDRSSGSDQDGIIDYLTEHSFFLVAESESPYPINLYTGTRDYLLQLDYSVKDKLLQGDLPGVQFEGSRILTHGKVNSALSIRALKLALKCGTLTLDSSPDVWVEAGPVTATVYADSLGKPVTSQGVTYEGLYYFPPDAASTGHVAVIIGWVDRSDPHFYEVWNEMTGPNAQFTGFQRLCFDDNGCPNPFQISDGTPFTLDEIRDSVSTLFIVLDNHDLLLHYLPAFSEPPEQMSSDYAFIEWPSVHKMDFSTFYPPSPDGGESDSDEDGVPDFADNCPRIANQLIFVDNALVQPDVDGDGQGDACDDDIDGDGVSNSLDMDAYNKYFASDLNGNDRYERSLKPFIHSTYTEDGTTWSINEGDYGPGYRLVWNAETDHEQACRNECNRLRAHFGYYSDNFHHWLCTRHCASPELFEFNSFEPWAQSTDTTRDPRPSQSGPLNLLGINSFPCMYQNYFHPHCQRWVRFLSALKKTDCARQGTDITIWCDATQFQITDFSQRLANILDQVFAEDWDGKYQPTVLTSLTALRGFLQNRVLDRLVQFGHLAQDARDLLQLMEHLDSDFFDLNYEFLDMSMELAKMNPCDLVHQTRLVTFMQDWIVDGLVSGFSDATAFGDWLDDRLEDCQILFSSSSYRANVQVWNAGGSALGGHSPASGIEGLTRFQNCSSVEKKIEFSVQKQVTYWDRGAEDWNSKWVDAQLSHMRLGVCPCTGTDFTEDRCRSRVCPQIGPSNGNVQGSHTVFTEDQEGIYNVVTTKWNQAWDPIYSTGTQGLAAYTQGSVPCDHAAVQNSEVIPSSMTTNPPRWARGFCSGKNLQRGSVAFHRDHVYDVDAWLRSTTDGFTSFRKISEDPNGVIMKQIGHLQARISAHNPDVAASDIFPKSRFSETNWIKLYSETGIKGHSQIAQPLYEKEGCATGWAIHHWNPQVIHVAPTLEGPLGDPIPWAFVKNTDGPHVLQLFGPDGIRVQTVMELPATVMQVSPWRSGAAKTFLLAHQRNGVVHRLQLADASPLGITNEKEMVGVLPAVEDPVWVRTGENRLLLAGRRAGAIWLYAVWVLEPDRLPIGLTISVPLGRISGSSVALSKQENTVIAAVGDGTRVRLWQVQPTQPYVQRGEFATAESVENIVHHDMTWLLKTTQSLLKWTPDIGLAAMPTAGLPSDRSGCAVSVSPEGSPVLLCPKSADGVLPVGYTLKDGNWEVRSCYASF